jgi:hypothetical protein
MPHLKISLILISTIAATFSVATQESDAQIFRMRRQRCCPAMTQSAPRPACSLVHSCNCSSGSLLTTNYGNACCAQPTSLGGDCDIETQSWLIRYLDRRNQTIMQGTSSTPITPPTSGWGISIGGVRYVVDSVNVASLLNPSLKHLETVIDVRLIEAR